MKMIELYRRAVLLTGEGNDGEYLINNDNSDELFYINQALSELGLNRIDSPLTECNLSSMQIDAAVYFIAYLISLKNGDSQRSEYLCSLFTLKRSAALSATSKRKNTLP